MIRLLPILALASVFLVVAVIHVWSGRVSIRSSRLLDPTTPPTSTAITEAERSAATRVSIRERPADTTVSSSETPFTTAPSTSATTASTASPPPSAPTRSLAESLEEDPDQVTVSVSPPEAISEGEASAMVADAVERLHADVTGADRNPYQQITSRGALVKVSEGVVTVWLAWEGTRRDGSVDTHRTPIRIGEEP